MVIESETCESERGWLCCTEPWYTVFPSLVPVLFRLRIDWQGEAGGWEGREKCKLWMKRFSRYRAEGRCWGTFAHLFTLTEKFFEYGKAEPHTTTTNLIYWNPTSYSCVLFFFFKSTIHHNNISFQKLEHNVTQCAFFMNNDRTWQIRNWDCTPARTRPGDKRSIIKICQHVWYVYSTATTDLYLRFMKKRFSFIFSWREGKGEGGNEWLTGCQRSLRIEDVVGGWQEAEVLLIEGGGMAKVPLDSRWET